jgi:hypothetical protein
MRELMNLLKNSPLITSIIGQNFISLMDISVGIRTTVLKLERIVREHIMPYF